MEDTYDLLAIIGLRLLLAWLFACIGSWLGTSVSNRDSFGCLLALNPLVPLMLTIMGLAAMSHSLLVSFLCLVAVAVYAGFVDWPWWSCLLVVAAYAVQVPVVARAWRS